MASEEKPSPPQLPASPVLKDYQTYIQGLESYHGWLDVDLVHNCFLMGEEVGELFKAIRTYNRYYEKAKSDDPKADVAEEIVDVFNYLLAIANRLDIDLEAAFRKKNARNIERSWDD
ncbi:MAG: hypothetical protein CMH52_03975 [Myxococcales bacterium]|nr:hypothetical protein [Myxococcales bacterium]